MIVDLNLKGKQVVIVGGGREATRKVDALLYQDCKIIVLAGKFSSDIQDWGKEGRVELKETMVSDGGFLKEFDRLILVMGATNDKELNRKIVEAAKELRCFAYAVDDPDVSDFNHPAVINILETVQVAISTGGRSPLMAGHLKKKIEPHMKHWISWDDDLKIQLQFRLREKIKPHLSTPEERKKFLELVLHNEEVNHLIMRDQLDKAEAMAMALLKNREPLF